MQYLYLLFDEENVVNSDTSNFIFTTEGHILAVQAYSEHSSRQRPLYRSSRRRNSTTTMDAVNPLLPPTTQSYPGQLQCPLYVGTRVRTGSALRGSIRDRSDFEYARLLSGVSVSAERALGMGFPAATDATSSNESPMWPIPTTESNKKKELAVATAADREWWDPNGWCEVPRVEEYVSFSIVDRALCSRKLH
jgi:hypothetical protein